MRRLIITITLAFFFSGCGFAWKSVRERELEKEVEQLKGRLGESDRTRAEMARTSAQIQEELRRLQEERTLEVKRLTEEKYQAAKQAAREKEKEGQELLRAKEQLVESLKKELGDAQAKLTMTERGLVLTFLDEIFFDSGKAQVKPEGMETLKKVAEVLKETVPDSPVAIEGHTDNEPIRYSGWKSNWELSAARALAVLHDFVDSEGVAAERVQAVGFGEFHPVAPNDTAEGRRQNRRVEVVILPKMKLRVKNEE